MPNCSAVRSVVRRLVLVSQLASVFPLAAGTMAGSLAGVALLAAGASTAHAQTDQRLRQRQTELDRLRRERAELERRQLALQRSVRSLTSEVANLDRQAATTAELVRTLDAQLNAITAEIDSATTRVTAAQQELVERRTTMQRHVRDIYKRGPLFSVEAMLAAQSFGELLARYKYLHELARHDRTIVARVERLRDEVAEQRGQLVRLQDELVLNREEKSREEERLRQLERERRGGLASARRNAQQTTARLRAIARDEQRVTSLIATLDAERRAAEARAAARAPAGTATRPATATSTLRTSDIGRLDWPVEGEIIYRFGRVVSPNNTATRWNGVGIGTAVGTPVKALSAGEVALADRLGTYGLTVIVQHGGGDYSVYGSLGNASVQKGDKVTKGQVIGTVGIADPELGPHLHLEIRRDRGQAVDPLEWLRGRGRE